MTGSGTKDDPYIPDGSWDDFLAAIAKVNDPDNRIGDAYVKMPPNIEYDLSKIYPDGGGTRTFDWNCLNFDGNGLVVKNGSFDAHGGGISSVFRPYGPGYSSTSYTFYVNNVSFLDIQLTNKRLGDVGDGFSLFGCVGGKSGSEGDCNTKWFFTNCEFRTSHAGGSALTMYGTYNDNYSYSGSQFVSCNFDIVTNNTWLNHWLVGYAGTNYDLFDRPTKLINCKILVETAVPYNTTSDLSRLYTLMSCKNCYFAGTVGRFLAFSDFVNSILNIDLAEGVKDNNGTLLTDWQMVADNLNGEYGGEPRVGQTVGSVAKEGPAIYRNNGCVLGRVTAEDLTNPKALHDAGLPIDPGE